MMIGGGMGDILDRIDWEHYRRTSHETMHSVWSNKAYRQPLPNSPSALHDKYAIKDNEVEFVKFCQMIDAFNRHDDWLIMKQRCKRLSAESKQRGVDAVCW